jgi:AcrR family transcriptional regulator
MEGTQLSKSAAAILSSAQVLFWKYGITKVTVEEICQGANLSKMTFYRHFDNKEEVAGRVIEQLIANGRREHRIVMDTDLPFPDKVRQMIALKHKNVDGISREFLQDVYGTQYPELKQRLDQAREASLQLIVEDFRKAQAEGWIRRDIKLPFILYMLNDIREKLMDERLAAMFDSTADFIMELTHFFFYGISKKEADA